MLSLLKYFLEPHLSPYTFPVPFQPRSVCCSLSSFSLGWGRSVKVLVAQLCPILCYPMDYSLQAPLSMDSPGRNTGVGNHFLLQRIFPIQGQNPGLLYCRQILYCLSHQESPRLEKRWHFYQGLLPLPFFLLGILTKTQSLHFLILSQREACDQKSEMRDFPGGPVPKTLHSQCRGLGFNP